MLAHRRCLQVLVIQAALSSISSASAFDDKEFCVAAQQFAFAANQDIGLWLDRATRNGGMTVSCDARAVEFSRFIYAPSDIMNENWKRREAEAFNSVYCNSVIWKDAITNGWRITLTVTATDGARVSIDARCRHK